MTTHEFFNQVPPLVNYDAAELPELLGRSTRELSATLGPQYERELVHRDDLVVLR